VFYGAARRHDNLTRENYKVAPFHDDIGRSLSDHDRRAARTSRTRTRTHGDEISERALRSSSTFINPFERPAHVQHRTLSGRVV
jgi:hypothetical protein